MQIRKFLAPSLKKAIEKMKVELGDEAVVLSTRMLNGANQKKMFEVTAGLETDTNTDNLHETPVNIEKNKSGGNINSEIRDTFKNNFESEIKINFKQQKEKLNEKRLNEEELSKGKFQTKNKMDFTGGNKKFPFNEKINAEKINAEKVNAEKINKSNTTINNVINEIEEILISHDVEKRFVDKISTQLNRYQNLLTPENIDQYTISVLSAMIPTEGFEVTKKRKPKIIGMVGPTGVGKTTCIAKLALISKILHKLDVGLITIDTYRLGALDQLKVFSEVSNIDLLIAYDPEELKKHVNKFKNKDLIFVDTVGRSQNDKSHLQDVAKFLSVVKLDENYLVLNSTGTSKYMIDVATKFRILNYNGLIFSKIDEAVTYGSLLNVANITATPIKYLTNGQVIPDDIIAADSEFIANLIYSGKVNQ